eukprot:GHVL01001376.1.p2 GENE.GHVL01001376.1~~GHVL01001376.1.p2  ORF type:complete len:120 (+),score=7.15 GHVL01001376.1:2290-2649(+)
MKYIPGLLIPAEQMNSSPHIFPNPSYFIGWVRVFFFNITVFNLYYSKRRNGQLKLEHVRLEDKETYMPCRESQLSYSSCQHIPRFLTCKAIDSSNPRNCIQSEMSFCLDTTKNKEEEAT